MIVQSVNVQSVIVQSVIVQSVIVKPVIVKPVLPKPVIVNLALRQLFDHRGQLPGHAYVFPTNGIETLNKLGNISATRDVLVQT